MVAGINQSFGYTWLEGGNSIPQKTIYVSGATEVNVDTTLGSGVTQVAVTITQTKLVGFFGVSDQDLYLSTNVSGVVSGSTRLLFPANNPVVWCASGGAPTGVPFISGNVTTSYWSCSGLSGTTLANLSIRTAEIA